MFGIEGINLFGLYIQYETILYVCFFAALAADITADIMKQKISQWWVPIGVIAILLQVYFKYGALVIITFYGIMIFITFTINTMAMIYVTFMREAIFPNLENRERNLLIIYLYGLGILKSVLWPIMQVIPGIVIPKKEEEKEEEEK